MGPERRITEAIRAVANYVESPAEGFEEVRRRIDRRGLRTSLRALAPLAVALIGFGSFLVVRGSGDPGAIRVGGSNSPQVIETAPSPTPSPSPTTTPSPEASPSAPANGFENHYRSATGDWEFDYPKGLIVELAKPSENPPKIAGWYLYKEDSPGLFSSIDFIVMPNSENLTLDERQEELCKDPPSEVRVLECRSEVIRGRTWAWAVYHESISGGATDVLVSTVLNGRVYSAVGFVNDGKDQDRGIALVKAIFRTFVLHQQ